MVTVHVASRWRARPIAIVAATAMAVATILAPPLAGIAAAATDPLKEVSSATYTLDPNKGAVHVVVETAYTNRKPNSGGFFYFYDKVGMCLHAEASAIKVTDAQGSLSFTSKHQAAFEDKTGTFFACTQVTARLRHALLYKRTTTVRVAFDLVGDARSASRVRAGQGYATFPVWAWGDDNQGKVAVHLPAGFVATILENTMTTKANADGSTVLSAVPPVSREFWVQIQATRQDGFKDEVIPLGDGASVDLRSLLDDPSWTGAVSPNLQAGLPVVRDLIGLAPPGTGPIELREQYVPILNNVVWLPLSQKQGYGVGPYRSPTEIAIGESLDEHAALSAASTIWFNDTLLRGRWISSGLADEYGALALASLARPVPAPPTLPRADDPGAQPLELWVTPYLQNSTLKQEAIVIKQADAREAYGANASWYVVHALVAAVGVERMRDVFDACAHDQIAYLGAGVPETVDKVDGWQRFLDLLEEHGGGKDVELLFKEYVLSSPNAALLGPRVDARVAYADLLARGTGWSAPLVVRMAMSNWDFPAAMKAITEANGILDLRKQVVDAAGALGLTPGPALQAAYESASVNLDDARQEAQAELAALAAISKARAGLDAPNDPVTAIGLLGVTPETSYAAATAAFANGDLDGALAGAAAAAAAITNATAAGQQRLVIGGATLGLLLLITVLLLLRRRRRRSAIVRLAAAGSATTSPLAPTTDQPSTDAATAVSDGPPEAPPPPTT